VGLLLAVPFMPAAGAGNLSQSIHPPTAPLSGDAAPRLAVTEVGPFVLAAGERVSVPDLVRYELAHGLAGPAPGPATSPPPSVRPPARLPSAAAQGPVAPPSAASSCGSVSGRIVDATTGAGVIGAYVNLTPISGGSGCGPEDTRTNASGGYNVSGPYGPATLSASGPLYLANTSLVTLSSTPLRAVPLSLEHFGLLEGTVETTLPGHTTLASVNVSVLSRSGAVLGGTTITSANGTFALEAPPLPDTVILYAGSAGPTGSSAYLPNETFGEVQPYQTLDLGTVYLEALTPLNLSFVDATTGLPIGPLPYSAVACELADGYCPSLATSATVYAVPGPTELTVDVFGYLRNASDIGPVPTEPAGRTFAVTVRLVPDGIVTFSTGLQGDSVAVQDLSGLETEYSECSLDELEMVYFANSSLPTAGTCSLSGHTGQIPLFAANDTAFVPPLRASFVVRDYFPPISYNASHGVPYYSNTTWTNATPGVVSAIGPVDLVAGGYIGGRIAVHPSGSGPLGNVSRSYVQICSRAFGECGTILYTFGSGTTVCGVPYQGYPSSCDSDLAACGVPANVSGFCQATPPGADTISVTAPNLAPNVTWVEVPINCCAHNDSALSLPMVTEPRETLLNLTPPPTVSLTGRVTAWTSEGLRAEVNGSVIACDLLLASGTNGCDSTSTNGTGAFVLNVSAGWTQVTALGAGGVQNATWIDATGNNTTGTIVLPAAGAVYGLAAAPDGQSVVGAQAQICPASEPSACQPLQGAVSNSEGLFYALWPSSPFPSNAYRLVLSSPGYSDGVAWTNLTANATSSVGTVEMVPTGAPPAVPLRGPTPSVGGATSWFDGFVVSATDRQPVLSYRIVACPVLSNGCSSLPVSGGPTPSGGFNESFPDGPLRVNITESGFEPLSVQLNLSGPTVHLGELALVPYPRLQGRVVFGPWSEPSGVEGLGPVLVAFEFCPHTLPNCVSLSGPVSPSGIFDLGAPVGNGALTLSPLQTAPYVVAGGMGTATVEADVGPNGTVLNETLAGAPTLYLFPILTLREWDAGTWNGHAQQYEGAEMYAGGNASLWGSQQGYGTPFNAEGMTEFSAPPGTTVFVEASARDSWPASELVSVPGTIGTSAAPDLVSLPFGWIRSTIVASPASLVMDANVEATYYDAGNGTTDAYSAMTGSGGYVNMSAPPFYGVTFRVLDPLYLPAQASVSVPEGHSVNVSLSPLVGGQTGLWIASTEVNTVGVPPRVTLRDAVSATPIPQASIFTANATGPAAGQPLETPVLSNELGQFLVETNPGAAQWLSVEKPGYGPRSYSLLNATPGVMRFSTLNLTGNGILAGTLLDGPTGAPLALASVYACSSASPFACTSVETNDSGGYWISLPPGTVNVSFNASGYDNNVSWETVICSDCFARIPPLEMFREAVITGTAVAAPNGTPIADANVTLCPHGFLFQYYCDFPFATNASGGFSLVAPLGLYTLSVTAPGYAEDSLTLALTAGTAVRIGTLVLEPNGTLAGEVVSDTTALPLPGASVVACPIGNNLGCGAATTGPNGTYAIPLAPGSYFLTATAPGYSTVQLSAFALPGVRTIAPLLVLPYLGPGGTFAVSGTVTTGPNGTVPVGGAAISAAHGGVVVATTSSGPAGGYALSLPWGSYTIQATAGGFGAQTVALTVHGAVSGTDFRLAAFAWPIAGTVTVSPTGHAAVGLPILESGRVLATTGPTGAFALALPNGTYSLLLGSPGGGSPYQPIGLRIEVTGAPLALPEVVRYATGPVTIGVWNARSGAPVPGAAFRLDGTLEDRSSWATNATTGSSGGSAIELPYGTFTANVSAPGYATGSVNFSVAPGGAAVNVTLEPLATAASGSLLGTDGLLGLLAGIGLVAAAVGVVLVRRRRPGLPPGGPDEEAPAPETGETDAVEDPMSDRWVWEPPEGPN
jgi:hypothetical protein